ncbi:MAG: hypothetical protein Q7S57_06400 [bacterium]|nr:hypothetical protein [bacterium]
MTNISTGRYIRDIKISAFVALVFMVVLFGMFMANVKYGFSERFVNVFVAKIYGGA